MIKIVLVDDHTMVRSLLRDVISKSQDMEVVADFENGEDFLDRISAITSDVIIMDVSLSGKDGIETIKSLRAMGSQTPVLCLSMHLNRSIMNRAFKVGGNGYAVKHDPFEVLTDGIRTVAKGQRYVAPSLAEEGTHTPDADEVLVLLSPREREIFDLVAAGQTAIEIADKLLISERTVDFHRRNISDKTGLKRIQDIVKFATRNGLVIEE